MFEAESRLALANLDALAAGRVLILGAGSRDLPRALAGHPGVASVHLHQHNRWAAAATAPAASDGFTVSFGAWLPEGTEADAAILMLPKETERLRMTLAMARSAVAAGGRIVVLGHNKAGIRAAPAVVDELVAPPEVLDTRFHCRALSAVSPGPAPAALDDWRSTFAFDDLTVVSYPGLFAHGRTDEATAMLLRAVALPREGRALDMGCGAGVIAASLARAGLDVDAVDADALALQATTETLAVNGLAGRVWASDVYAEVSDRYRLILSNPPFHAGVRTTHAVADRLIAGAPEHLGRNGELWVVANRFLDYLTPMKATFAHVDVVEQDTRFRVLRGHR